MATIEVRDQDVALFRHRLRETRDRLDAQYEQEEPTAADEDLAWMMRGRCEAEALAQQATGTDTATFTGEPSALIESVEAMIRGLIDEAKDLSRFGPLDYECLARLADSIAWWSAENGRLDKLDREKVAV